jgi:hypothetical protein
MSTNCFTNIHIRDFINEVGRDPTRPEYDSALQLHSNVHVPSVQGEELSDNFDTRNIPTLIRFFAPAGQVDQFKTNGFVYTTASFNIINQDGFPQLLVNTFSANW